MRGKIRDSVRPALEQWDSRSIDGLFKLSEITRKLYVMIDLNIANIFNRIRKTKLNEYYFECDACENNLNCDIFWSRFFIKFSEFTRMPMASHKSIASLIERLANKNTKNQVNVNISKYIRFVYKENTISLFCRKNLSLCREKSSLCNHNINP
jgi:hypothetical protein